MKVTCENINKSYRIDKHNSIDVLKNINLEINDNSFIALSGASGAGKSTLLHIIGAMDEADNGSILFSKSDIIIDLKTYPKNKIPEFRNKHIGFIFQFHHLLPEFSAIENVMMPLLIKGEKISEAKIKALKLMDITGVSHRSTHKPMELSGGEQQRIAIARALINNPDLLIADEPTGNLDEKNSEIVLDLITNLRNEFKITCLIATHSNIVSERADTIITMKDGMIV